MKSGLGFPASAVKLTCLVVVLVGCIGGAVGGRSDLSVMLAVFGLALFVGLGLVPMSKVSAAVRLPAWFSMLFLVQAVAIALFPLLQPVSGNAGSGTRVGLAGLLGQASPGSTGGYQVGALLALLVAIGCCLGAFVALRQQAQRPDWVQPPAEPIGFYAEGRGTDGRER